MRVLVAILRSMLHRLRHPGRHAFVYIGGRIVWIGCDCGRVFYCTEDPTTLEILRLACDDE